MLHKQGKIAVATIGSHSALEICYGCAKNNLKSIVFSQKGRDKQYLYYLKTIRKFSNTGIIDMLVRLDNFKDLLNKSNIELMNNNNTVFIPNRSFCVYLGYEDIEKNFDVPIFGNRYMLRAEERTEEKNQYKLMENAGVRTPKTFKINEIDRPVIVKINEKERAYERAFFIAIDGKDYENKANEMIKKGIIDENALKNARIEELIVGPQFNFNFFYSPLEETLDLMGIDMRRQSNIEGFSRLPYWLQPKIDVKTIEVGHVACTIRESLLSKVYEIAEKIVETSQKMFDKGIIGPFAIQAIITAEKGKEDIVVFDLSFRIPGSPGIKYTPYSAYLYLHEMSMGERIALEIKNAHKENMLDVITT
ncbi:MAG: DUF1297 domain-containing protein [Candidatus Micrarchaeota archaeon]|nr:DUF1297 domain-containing protein [Candidatus Micrarchaeota archaeon]